MVNIHESRFIRPDVGFCVVLGGSTLFSGLLLRKFRRHLVDEDDRRFAQAYDYVLRPEFKKLIYFCKHLREIFRAHMRARIFPFRVL